jgi:transcriptional regulator with XRE-family HTH domain
MISRVERAESSATAQLLVKLSGALGVTLSELFARAQAPLSPVSRRDEQTAWRDPESGYVRRRVSPASSDGRLDLVDVALPPGARVSFDSQPAAEADQLVLVLEGRLDMALGDVQHHLCEGDCLHMGFDQTLTFHNPTDAANRYLVVLSRPRSAGGGR